jgi:hypothetical protein
MPAPSLHRRTFLAGTAAAAAGLVGLTRSPTAGAAGKPTTTTVFGQTTTTRKPPKTTTTVQQSTTSTTTAGNDGLYHDRYDRY